MKRKWEKASRGVISVFLSIILLPFLSLGAILVETSRYTAAVETMEQAMATAGLSTLGNYDSYLLERFGVLATSQTQSIDAVYSSYFDINSKLASIDSCTSTVSGLNALSDTDVLYRQVLEAAKLSAPTKFMVDAIDLPGIIKKLEGLKHLDKLFKSIKSAGKMTETYADLADHVEALNEVLLSLTALITEYNTKYATWREKANEVIGALGESELPDDYDDLTSEEETAREEFVGKISEIVTKMDEYKKAVKAVLDDVIKLEKNASDFTNDAVNMGLEYDKDDAPTDYIKAQEGQQQLISGAVNNGVKSVLDHVTLELNGVSEETIAQDITNIETMKTTVEGLTLTKDTALPLSFDDTYHLQIKVMNQTNLQKVLDEVERQFDDSTNLWDMLDTMGTVMGSLFKLELVYDGKLCAVVDQPQDPGRNYTVDMISSVCSAVENLGGAVVNATTFRWISFIRNVAKVFEAIVNFFDALISYIGQILNNLFNLSYEGLLFNIYLMYNLPNRLNSTSGSSLTDFSYSKLPKPQGLGSGTPYSGPLSGITGLLHTWSSAGDDTTFVGAEYEYILQGQPSEIANQALCFVDLYFMRMLLNAIPIFSNEEVKSMANIANLLGVGWLVYLLEILLEPLVDTIMLVNGEKIAIWKTKTIFLTPSGIEPALKKLVNYKALTPDQQENLKDKVQQATHIKSIPSTASKPGAVESWATGLFELSYTEYLLINLILTGNRESSLKRLQNIMQMEAGEHYQNSNFQLSQSYTMLCMTTQANVTQLLPIPSLSSRSVLSTSRSIYRGY